MAQDTFDISETIGTGTAEDAYRPKYVDEYDIWRFESVAQRPWRVTFYASESTLEKVRTALGS